MSVPINFSARFAKEYNVSASHAEKSYEVYNGVSTRDVPSAAWGYSALSRTTVQIAGWVSVFVLLMFNFGNHHGHVETIWLVALAALLAIGLIIYAFEPRFSRVRTLTGHNKPVGHIEPDWAYDQKTLSGPYSELTDGQLRALNIDPARVSHLRVAPKSTATTTSELTTGSTASEIAADTTGSTAQQVRR